MEGETNSLKILILTIADYLKEILRRWYLYIVVGLLLGAFFYKQYKSVPINFVASGSLMTGGNSGGGLSGILQFAGQLGIGKSQAVSSEMLVELLSTETIIFKTLLEKVEMNGRKDFLVNHYLDFYPLDQQSTVEGVANFRFSSDSVDFNGIEETSETILLKDIRNTIIREQSSASTSKNGIVRINFLSESEPLAKWFVDKSMRVLKTYYVEQTINREEENLNILAGRLDSVQLAMESADYALESWYKTNQTNLRTGTVSPKEYMKKMKLERTATIASTTYTEVLKSREIAQMNYEAQMPMIQIIDFPLFPLSKQYPNLFKYIFYTILLTAIPLTLLIILVKMIRDALK